MYIYMYIYIYQVNLLNFLLLFTEWALSARGVHQQASPATPPAGARHAGTSSYVEKLMKCITRRTELPENSAKKAPAKNAQTDSKKISTSNWAPPTWARHAGTSSYVEKSCRQLVRKPRTSPNTRERKIRHNKMPN